MMRRTRDAIAILGCALLAACGSTPPARYFQLVPMTAPAAAQPLAQRIGVGPVVWPEYLERPQRIVRQGENSLVLVEGERWAEPLEANFSRVLRENLARLTGGPQIIAHPWPASDRPALQLRLDVLRFDSDAAGKATLQARWQWHDSEARRIGPAQHADLQENAAGPSGEAAIAAQNRALHNLSKAIAESIPK